MKKIIIAFFALGTVLQSCERDNLTALNSDPNSYYTTVPSTLVTYAQKQLSDYVNTPSVNINNFRLTMQYWQETTYSDESQYNFTQRNVSDNVFLALYVRTLKNLDQAKKLIMEYQPTASEAITWPKTMKNQLAIIDMMQIYAYQISVDTFGNVPYTQALDSNAHPLPAYDDAKVIYGDLIKRLRADLANLDTTGTSFATGEKYYNGDVTKWKKFGNSLLLKAGISLADSDAALAQATAQAAITGGVFTSSADDCNLAYLTASPNYSQIYANVVASNRNDFVAGKTIVDQMNLTGDARRSAFFRQNMHYDLGKVTDIAGSTITFSLPSTLPAVAFKVGDDVFKGSVKVGTITAFTATSVTLSGFSAGSASVGDSLGFSFYYKGGVIGVKSSFANNSNPGAFAYSSTTPGILLNYTEVAFYLAEAQARWNIGGDTAANLFAKAVTASFLQWGRTAAEATAYLTANPYDATNWKKSIGTEAWVAMYNQPLTGWNFYRRLDYPVLLPAVGAVSEANNKVPVRLLYPVTEQSTNPTNYQSAGTAIGGNFLYTKIFWDKN